MKTSIMLLACAVSLAAQTQSVFLLKLDNGVRITYQVWNGVDSREAHAEATGHVVRRTLNNPDGSPWLGFDMHVDKDATGDFLVWFDPAPGYPFFAQAPLPRHVLDGDRVMLNLLEQPVTGKKIFDSFQVLVNLANRVSLPWPFDSPPSLLPADAALRLSHASLRLNGTKRSDQAGAVLSGSQVAIDVPLVGRFNLSSSPQEGYYLDALANGNQIVVALDARYEIDTDAPVVDRPGSYFLWVKFEPTPRTTANLKMDGPAPLAVTIESYDAGPIMSVKNVSAKNVVAYTIQMKYRDPNSGKGAGSGAHGAFRQTDNPMAPGQVDVSPKPIPAPVGAAIATDVDLVIFQDGSCWGPASSRAAQQQLKRAQQSGIVR